LALARWLLGERRMRHHLGLAVVFAALAVAPGCGGTKVCLDSGFAAPTAAGSNSGSPGGSSSSGASGGSSSSGGPLVGAPSSGDPSRAIAEADIVELGQNWLYAMSASGNLAVVDVSVPGSLTLLGTTTLPGQPFEMYERGTVVLAMTNAAFDAHGQPIPVTTSDPAAGSSAPPSTTPSSDPSDGAALLALDMSHPAAVKTLATFPVPGQIADSRIVGNILYLVTYENGTCYSCGSSARTVVTTFDVSDPTAVKRVDQMTFTSGAPDTYNLAWGMAWKRSIVATTQRLYLGGQAYVPNPNAPAPGDEGIIDVVDISDPAGHLAAGAHLTVAGAILNRWQMDESSGVLRVISQQGAGFTGNGTAMPVVATFQVQSTTSITPLGHTTLSLPMQEGLRSVHFDGPRAYAITFNQTDPLFVIDLSTPSAPVQRGQLSMPGWMFYLAPFGDRVVGLGVDRTDPNGSLNVSLFDVSNMDSPTLLKRVAFGANDIGEDYQILNYELPEDQDRIQKAFAVFDSGLIAIPFSSTSGYQSTGCSNPASGVQLVQWANDTLQKQPLLPITGNPRRAIDLAEHVIAVSDSNVASFSLAGPNVSVATASVTIGTCVTSSLPGGGGPLGGDGYPGGGGYGGPNYGTPYYGGRYVGGGCQ
jgi:hypothetical protein